MNVIKDIKKRDRGRNYTEKEKEELLNIIEKYLNVVENKKTDSINSKKKQDIWTKIQDEFNAIQENGERSACQLKTLYEALKKKAKPEKADDTIELYKTGGGTYKKKLDSTGDRIISMLGSNIDSLSNIYDSNEIDTLIGHGQELLITDETRPIQITDQINIDFSENIHEFSLNENVNSQPSTPATDNYELNTFTPKINPKKKRKLNIDNTTSVQNKQKQEINDIKKEILLLKKETQQKINEKLKLELEEKKLDIAIKQKQYANLINNDK